MATRVLLRVAEDGAYAAPALDGELSRAGLGASDTGLATEIVYGTLRALPSIDARLDRHLSRPSKTDPWLRAALRGGAYQLLHLERVPPHAAVSETVRVVKEDRGPRLAGVANAVLRKIAAERPDHPTPPRRVHAPTWIERALADGLGSERAEALLTSDGPPPLGLRVTRGDPGAALEALRAARPDATFEASALVPGAILARGAGDPRALPGYAEGTLAVQELGSQRVAQQLGAEPGERIADLCCGHGTKTLSLAADVGERGSIDAVDLYEEKLAALEVERARLGIDPARVRTHAVDLTRGLGGLPEGGFDRVLLDAPCTGLGTVRRRPELMLRLREDDPARLGELQRALAENAKRLVRPGGVLLVATCSGTRAEGAALAEAIGGELDAIGPWLGEPMDGYQTILWRRGPA
ncbi:MAG: transcription antitermination factor NusB [Sandaracinaceae bacterium]